MKVSFSFNLSFFSCSPALHTACDPLQSIRPISPTPTSGLQLAEAMNGSNSHPDLNPSKRPLARISSVESQVSVCESMALQVPLVERNRYPSSQELDEEGLPSIQNVSHVPAQGPKHNVQSLSSLFLFYLPTGASCRVRSQEEPNAKRFV